MRRFGYLSLGLVGAMCLLLGRSSSGFSPPPVHNHKHHRACTLPLREQESRDFSEISEIDSSISRRKVLETAAISTAALAAVPSLASAANSPAETTKIVTALMKKYISSANSNGAPEKHIPSVSVKPSSREGVSTVTVSVNHVMNSDADALHFIQAIWLVEGENASGDVAVAKVLPATEPSPPSLTVGAPQGVKLTPMIYCNLHGLWKGETFVV